MTLGYLPVTSVFASGMTYSPQDFGLNLTKTSSANGKVNYNLDWEPVEFKYNDDSSVPTTRYYVARRKVNPDNTTDTSGEYKWELRGNYTDEGVKVLNIYPDKGDGLKSWMESISHSSEANGFDVNISVDSQSLSSFNKTPESKLKKQSDGSYNYDVVVFGFWDSNNHLDISKSRGSTGLSAYDHMNDFIKSGYGVIFGHDTIQMKDNSRNPNFTSLLTNNSSFTVVSKAENGWHYSEKIAVKQQGALTTYPFDIYGKSLKVPMTHNVNQLATDTSTVYMTFEKNYYPSAGDGPYYNYNVRGAKETVMYDNVAKKYVTDFDVADTTRYLPANSYLMKDDNIAFIQSGHSSGKTSDTEQMILANTIYSLKQMITGNKAVDQLLDNEKPDAPSVAYNGNDLAFSAEDNGSTYKYRIIASPVGLSIYDQWNNIKVLLDNESVKDFVYPDERRVAFSKLANTGEVKAEVKSADSFEYYVDKKAHGEKRDGEFLDYTDNYVLPKLSDITEDSYLHIWTYDKANNVSFERPDEDGEYETTDGIKYTVYNGITNINLWEAYPKLLAKVKYEDVDKNAIKDVKGNSEYITSEMLGSVFAPTVPNIGGYRYTNSDPVSGKVTIGASSENAVTHIYDKLLSKQIKVVINDSTNQVINYRIVNGVATDEFVIDLPESYQNYEYSGYYTVGESSIADTSGTSYSLGDVLRIDSTDTLYVHYRPKTVDFNVIVKDFENDKTYADFTVTGKIGHTKVVSASEIQSKISGLAHPTAYQNYTILKEDLVVDVEANTSDQIITLVPRTKVILYLGYEFPTVGRTTSSQGVSISTGGVTRDGAKILGTEEYRFNGTDYTRTISENVSGITDGWTFFKSTALQDGAEYYIDYTNKVNVVGMVYYKGTLPRNIYTINATYNNLVGGLMPTTSVITTNPLEIETSIDNQALVPIEEYQDVVGGVGIPNGTDFEVDYINVTRKNSVTLESETKKYGATDNIYEFMPDMGSDGALLFDEYYVDIYYRPYGEVVFEEYLCDTNDANISKLIDTKVYKKLYEESVTLSKAVIPYPYEVAKVVVDGVEQSADYDFITKIDKYSKNIKVYYRPLTYDLKVMARSNGVDNYEVYDYEDVAINSVTKFSAPTFNGYTFKKATSTSDVVEVITEGNKVVFNPKNLEGEYVVYLDYNQNAEIEVTYIKLDYGDDGKVVEQHLTREYTEDVFIGENFSLSTLDVNGYALLLAYMNGKAYTELEEGNEYSFKVDRPMTKVYLAYAPEIRYAVELKANPTGGGEVFGNTTVFNDNLFYAGAKVTISATANEGYEFVNWTSGDVVLDDASILATSFIMPEKGVTITANFKLIEEETDGDDGDSDVTPTEPIDPVVPVKPPEIVFPERPTIPGDKGNIGELVEDPIGKIVRSYVPYIQGYPEGDVQPSGTITRAEVMQVVYNLYGYGLYRESYGDKRAINRFSDVNYNDWYSDAIAFCLDYGVVGGYSDGTIRPDEPITRGELATIIAKFVLVEGDFSSGLNDLEGNWAKDAIDKLYENGIISGYPDGTFRPSQTTVRSEFTVMVNKLVRRAENYNESVSFPDLPQTHWAYEDMMNAANGGVVNIDTKSVLDKLGKSK